MLRFPDWWAILCWGRGFSKTAAQSLINGIAGENAESALNDPDADGTRYRSLKDDPDRRSTGSGKAE